MSQQTEFWNDEIDQDFVDSVRDELGRLNGEWVTFVAFRDGISIAMQDTNHVTRNETLRLAENMIPGIFSRESSKLYQYWESVEERRIRERATIRKTTFNAVLQEEIKTLEDELKSLDPLRTAKALQSRLDSLKRLLQQNQNKEYYEGKLIQVDASRGTPLPGSNERDFFEFRLPANRGLRIRITHETSVEAINGVDLIYEHHEPSRRRIRIAVVQYKVMDETNIVPKSKKLAAQLKRLNNWYCQELPCISAHKPCSNFFRLPSCSAFLRATNKLQEGKSAGLSLGYYIPVCQLKEHYSKRGFSISAKNYEGETVTHRVFEDLFNSDILGSRWMDYDEIEEFYRKQKVINDNGTVSLQLQIFRDQ